MDGMETARRLIAEERVKQTGTLDLGKLGLTELPPELFALTHLRWLNLGSWYDDAAGKLHISANQGETNQLSQLPPSLGRLTRLERLSVWGILSLTSQEPIAQLTALQSLDCSGTQVTDLSPVQGLTALQSLNCSRTQVTDLSPVQGLTALQSLNCYHTQVTDLSPVQGLTALQSLYCSYTQVTDLSPVQGLTALRSLDCSSTPVTDLSPVQGLTALQSLDCFNTQVTDLSPVRGLTALEELKCSSTQVADLSPVQGLTALQKLDCSGTQITDLSPVQGLTALQSLYCSATPVTDLSPVQGLTALQSLDCSSTPVLDLTPVQGLTALQVLKCFFTQVTDLSPVQGLPKLKMLDADRCPLTHLPVGLVFNPSLETLQLHECPIPGVPSEVLSKSGRDNCLERLRSHLTDLRAGEMPVREAKLVVLGNGRVGKTQLCRKLRGLPYDESVPTTHGICVTAEPWAGTEETLHLWDFGGQDIYHGAHALFLRTRAIFVVAWHPEFETTAEQTHNGLVFRNYPLSYWLEYIRTLGGANSPVIVVQTQCDRAAQEVKRLPVGEEFLPFECLKSLHFSAKENRGQAALAEAIREGLAHLRERESVAVIGAGRMRVLTQLTQWRTEDQLRPRAERQHRTLTQAEFQQLCATAGGVSSPEHLLDYLHSVGAVFHRPGLFHDRIILDQSWALDAVYAVFERERAYKYLRLVGGRFSRSLLEMLVWAEYTPEEESLFLSLMESCGIAFQYHPADEEQDREAEYIAPDLLPERSAVTEQLAGRWPETDPTERRLVFEYPFLHPGLIRSLICDAGKRASEAGVYWRTGVWVYEWYTGCQALLEQEPLGQHGGRITVRVRGPREARGKEHWRKTLEEWLRERLTERSRLFGFPDVKPVRDEFDGAAERGRPGAEEALPAAAKHEGRRDEATAGPASASGPVFVKPPPESFAKTGPEVFVSYKWGDASPEGQRRQKLVDDLCAAMTRNGLKLHRDCDELQTGDRISEFMDRLTQGDFIITVISDAYLRSPYCMYELYRLYLRCGADKDRFLGKVIPLILPDAKVKELSDRLEYALYWDEERKKLQKVVKKLGADGVGVEAFKKYRLTLQFAQNVSDILEHLADKLMPRDFDQMAEGDFQEVIKLIGRRE